MTQTQKELKKINARIMKWREMLNKGLFSDPQLLFKRVRKGIPTSMRIKVWPQLIKVSKVIQRKSISYSKVLKKDSMDTYDINLDIPRTFPFESQQILQQSLFNVLKALSIQFPEIGYCQGMNFLTMRLLQVMDDDTVFYFMVYLLQTHKQICKPFFIEDDNFKNPGFVSRQNAVYLTLLQQFIPKVYAYMSQNNIEPVLYTPSWFLTLFSKSLAEEKFYRFFQCFLIQGYCFLYKMVLALIKLKSKQILQNNTEQNYTFIPDMKFYNSIDDNTLILTACKFQIDNQTIQKLEDDYNIKNRNFIESLEKSSTESYSKKVQSPRRVFQWTIDDFNKMSVSLVKFDE